MQYKQRAQTLVASLRKLPVKWYVVGVAVLILTWYGVAFGLKQSVQLSYAGDSCVPELTVLPQWQRSPGDAEFIVETRGGVGWLFATEVCMTPVDSPEQGEQYAALAPFGGWAFRTQYAVHVPKAPVANTRALEKPMSTTRELKIELSKPDTLHDYSIDIAGKVAKCGGEDNVLACDVEPLDLAQGKTYKATLTRSFADVHTTLVSRKVTTLPAVTLAQSSVQANEVVYAKPREFTLEMDKPLESAKTELVAVREGKPGVITSTQSIENGRTVRVTTEKDLPRDTQFELHVTEALARDGSGLDGLATVPFRTSGGPRPSGVNAQGADVAPQTTVVITFDQELSESQDISKFVQVTGATSQITRTANQLHVAVQAGKCMDVGITIAKGLLSKYDVPATDGWKHAYRTSCYTASTIGYSVRGRPITAYHFGNGGEAILFVGGIHGSEASSSLILEDLIDDLNTRARSIPSHRQVVVVPTLNPDGYASSARNNARNVNLNRNFATSDWTKDLQDTNGAVPGGGGESPMSEPETKAIAALSGQLMLRFVLSYHAVGSVVIGNLAGDSAARASTYASQVGYSVGTGRDAEIFDYAITGTYDDWLAQQLGVPSMIVELGSYTYRNYGHHKDAMWHVITN